MKHSRRSVLGAIGLGAIACRRPIDRTVLRLGYFPNLTHAPALTGVESGRFARALGATRLQTHVFNAGPAAIEALLSGSLDATYVGPSPVLAAWVRTRGSALRVVSGVASGGASFVVRADGGIRSAGDLRGKRLATPQLGNTQDVALRSYLAAHGLGTRERGGDVIVTPLGNADILGQFRLRHLDGAWVPEPWATRLVREAGGAVLLDERDLWPGRAFATTVLCVRLPYLRRAPDVVTRLVHAHAAEVEVIRRDGAAARGHLQQALRRIQGRPLPEAVLTAAWTHMDFTVDPLEDSLRRNARAAHALGFLRGDRIDGLVDRSLLPPGSLTNEARHLNE